MTDHPIDQLDLSIIAPAHNEQDNIGPLVEEIAATLATTTLSYEIIIVDDGSTDATAARLAELAQSTPCLRPICLAHTPHGSGHGQSAAFHAGFRAAHGERIVTLDADLQNDPADIPLLIKTMDATGADFVQGDRSRARADGFVRKASSWIGRSARRLLLGDTIRDTGCSLRIMSRDIALQLPLEFRGTHRFIPITARQLGYTVVEVPVSHRERYAGTTKYGIRNRALHGLIDCFAFRWMASRRRPVEWTPLTREPPS